jgi:hypothetical protein
MIIDKFVQFSGGKHHGRVQGQGSTSSFIQKTPAGFIDNSSDSCNSTVSIATSQNRGETLEEMEQRLEQRLNAKHERNMQEMYQQLRAEFQASQSVNQSRHQSEEEYRPGNVAFNNQSSSDDFFNGLQNEPVLQQLLAGDDFHISGFSNEFQNTGSWNQGGGNPNVQGGGNQTFQGGGNSNVQSGGNIPKIFKAVEIFKVEVIFKVDSIFKVVKIFKAVDMLKWV